MQDVNPDMDEIFKEAADKYPLKTNAAEWEAISQRLRAQENAESGIGNKRNWVLLSLLLLIPIGLIITQYFKVHTEAVHTVATVKDEQLKSLPATKERNTISKAEAAKKLTSEDASIKIDKPILPKPDVDYKNNLAVTFNRGKAARQTELAVLQSDKFHAYDNSNKNYLAGDLSDDIVSDRSIMFFENNGSKLSGSSKNLKTPAEKNSGSTKNDEDAVSKRGRFYIGGVLAPELISVKFQPVKRVSFNLGILMGYSISNKISFELGATFAHKYYYTDGKYTAPKSIRYDNSKILNVDAFSSITEMPFTLQYNIKNKDNTRLFVSAGCVSYVMHKEHYNYTYENNGQEKQSAKYDNKASDYWFSNAQIGFGYEHKINKIGNIKVEPYYRIPLKSVGISSLPITSIGVNFALTKNLKN